MTQHTLDLRIHFKLHKCFVGLIRSLCYLNLLKSDVKQKNYLSAASNAYYSLFHLSAAFVYFEPTTKLDLKTEVVMPNIASENVSTKRMFNISHKDLPQLVRNVSDEKVLLILQENLDKFRDLRELSVYGPYLQILSGINETDKKIEFHYRWVLQKIHFDITREKFIPFTEIFNLCEDGISTIENLLQEYGKFLQSKRQHYDNFQIRLAIHVLMPSIPYLLAPMANEQIIRDVEKEIKNFITNLNEKDLSIYEHSRHLFEDGINAVTKGEILSDISVTIHKFGKPKN